MGQAKIIYGIDLGTTNSSIARIIDGKPKIQKSDVQKDTMPSCVHFKARKKKDDSVVRETIVEITRIPSYQLIGLMQSNIKTGL